MSAPKVELTTIPVSPNDIYTNLQVGVIVVSEDKIIRILEKDRERTKNNHSWTVPFSFFITLIVAMLTTDFKSKWGLPAEGWQLLFYVATVGSLLFAIFRACRIKRKSVEALVKEIKGDRA